MGGEVNDANHCAPYRIISYVILREDACIAGMKVPHWHQSLASAKIVA